MIHSRETTDIVVSRCKGEALYKAGGEAAPTEAWIDADGNLRILIPQAHIPRCRDDAGLAINCAQCQEYQALGRIPRLTEILDRELWMRREHKCHGARIGRSNALDKGPKGLDVFGACFAHARGRAVAENQRGVVATHDATQRTSTYALQPTEGAPMHGTEKAEIGIIGGTGLYDMEGIEDVRDVELETPYGAPSSTIRLGTTPTSTSSPSTARPRPFRS